MMKKCLNCGTHNDEASKFCKACGVELQDGLTESQKPELKSNGNHDFVGICLIIISICIMIGAVVGFLGYGMKHRIALYMVVVAVALSKIGANYMKKAK